MYCIIKGARIKRRERVITQGEYQIETTRKQKFRERLKVVTEDSRRK